jgi:hypothetical protein
MFGLTTRRPDDVESEEAVAPDRRKVLLLGGLVAILVLVGGYFLVLPALTGSSSDAETTAVAPRTPRASAAPTPATDAPATVTPPNPVAGDSSGRDPFAPLPVEAEAAAATAAANAPAPVDPTQAGTTTATAGETATAADGSTTGGTTTATAADGATPGTGTSTSTSNGTATAAAKPVQLIAVNGGTAKIEVDSVAYPAKAGASFATGYKVVSVAPDAVTVSRGAKTVKLALGELQNI